MYDDHGNLILPKGTIENFMEEMKKMKHPGRKKTGVMVTCNKCGHYMGKNDQEGRYSQVPSLQEQDRTGGSGMNVQEAIQIAKREMGLTEIPPMTSEKRKVSAGEFMRSASRERAR
jgi:hypothetical protein